MDVSQYLEIFIDETEEFWTRESDFFHVLHGEDTAFVQVNAQTY